MYTCFLQRHKTKKNVKLLFVNHFVNFPVLLYVFYYVIYFYQGAILLHIFNLQMPDPEADLYSSVHIKILQIYRSNFR